MKKLYSKPEIMFESFVLSTNIAGDCKKITDTPSEGECAVEHDNGFDIEFLFTTSITNCKTKEPDGHNGICYHTFDGNSNLFNS